jgi:hypothetical protein
MTPVKKAPKASADGKHVTPRDQEVEKRKPLSKEEIAMHLRKRDEAVQMGSPAKIDAGQALKIKVLSASIEGEEILLNLSITGKVWRAGVGAKSKGALITTRVPASIITYGNGRPGMVGADSAGDDRPS